MKKLNFLLVATLGLSSPVLAGQQEEIDKAMKLYGEETRKIMDDAQGALKEGIPEVEEYFNNPGEMKTPAESFFGFGEKRIPPEPVIDPAKRCQSCRSQSVESLGKAFRTEGKIALSSQKDKKAPGMAGGRAVSALTPSSSKEVIVFVSLGMPNTILKQLAYEAEKTNVRLVIRGLLENSFQKTMIRLQELKISVEIDPTLFELFQVERVPTFVRCKASPEGALKEGHDRLEGAIFLRDALEKFERFGELT